MTGIDLIAADLSDFEQKLSSVAQHPKDCRDSSLPVSSFISGVQSNIINIRNTNSFMLMTINRCLDYTKASNGLKLVPKNETIDLSETLTMPLHCMINIQQKVKISLIPFNDQDICSHIITDKQWLQENVLCLLSNAVKYSAGGEVTIKVTKMSCAESIKLRKKEFPRNNKKDQNNCSHMNDDVESGLHRDCKRQITSHSRNLQKIVPITSDLDLSETVSNLDDCDCNSCKSDKEVEMIQEIREEAMVEVVDGGIGLSEEAMKTLFNPFQQTQRLAGGTGLGLYSLAKRIEALRGTYGVRQRIDGKQGSVFWFTLPYKPDKLTALHSQTLSKDEVPTRGRLNSENSTISAGSIIIKSPSQIISSKKSIEQAEKLRILLAEDTPSIAKMTTLLLRRQRHETVVAENGQIALDLLYKCDCEERYDVVLMDLQMPVMDGLEATRRIRAHEQSKNGLRQVIIGVSANSDHETMEEAFAAGIDDFLPKPFSVDAFMKAVRIARLQCDEKTQVF